VVGSKASRLAQSQDGIRSRFGVTRGRVAVGRVWVGSQGGQAHGRRHRYPEEIRAGKVTVKEQEGLETILDRAQVKLCRSRPYECQQDGTSLQIVADVVFAGRLRKPVGEELHSWNCVCHVER
jgi:hypothetical protein